MGLSVREKKFNLDFQMAVRGCHLGFPMGMMLAIFDQQAISILPTKFRVNRPFSSAVEVKNKFSRWRPWRLCWISDRNDFTYF